MRQTVIRNLLAQKAEQQRLEGGGEEAEAEAEASTSGSAQIAADGSLVLRVDSGDEVGADPKAFLASKLRFETGADGKERCVDRDGGVVMAAWET